MLEMLLPRPTRLEKWLSNTWDFFKSHNNKNARYLVQHHKGYANDQLIPGIYAPRPKPTPITSKKSQEVAAPDAESPPADDPSESKFKSRTIHDLHDVINTPVEYKTTLVPSPTHESSEENQAFQSWRLVAKQIPAADIPREKDIEELIPYLTQSIRGPITIWPQDDVPLLGEADVSDRFETDILKPCKRAINLLLKAWYLQYGFQPPFVDYDSRRYHNAPDSSDISSKDLKSYADHVFVIRKGYGVPATDEILIIIEEKKPESVKAVELAIYKRSDQGAIVSEGPFNMNRHLSQLLKYVQTMECPYTVLADCREFIAMEWSEVDQETMEFFGENKAMSYWDMQGSDGPPLRLSVLYLLIKALRSYGHLMTQAKKEAWKREKKVKEQKRADAWAKREQERKNKKRDTK